jgi:hypothetical protein
MRGRVTWILVSCLSALSAASGQVAPVPEARNLLTRYLDWADIHPPAQVGRLTVFPILLSRPVEQLRSVMAMQQALDRGVLVIEELSSAQVSSARFINKSRSTMVFLMAGELITGGKQNRTLRADALLGPGSSTVLPLYCVERGRWKGAGKFDATSAVVPQAVREKAAGRAGQDEIWSEVRRANKRLGSSSASEDLYAAVAKPENARQLTEWRRKVLPHLPRGCVGVVAAYAGRIVAADLFNSPELFSAMRDKVLNSYLSQYGWPLPVRRSSQVRIRPVTGEQVRAYLRDCYRTRFVPGELHGVGRVYHLRGVRGGQTLGYNERVMVHTALMSPTILPVRPVPRPVPLPEPRR